MRYFGEIKTDKDLINKEFGDLHYLNQYEVMPEASEKMKNHIVQYIGETDDNWTANKYYKCVEDSAIEPPTYSWQQLTESQIKAINKYAKATDLKDIEDTEKGDLAIVLENTYFGLYQYNDTNVVDETTGKWRNIHDYIIDGGNANTVYDSSIDNYNIDGGGA